MLALYRPLVGTSANMLGCYMCQYHPFSYPAKYVPGISVLPAPDGHLYTREPPSPRDCVRRTIVQLRMPSPQPALTCRGLEVRASRGFLRHRSSFVSSLCQAGVLARAARQPAGTGSAQIRWSIAPNRGVVARIVNGPHEANRQDPHWPMRYDTGRPRAVIRLRISQPRTASLPCPAGLRARRLSPMMDL